MSATDLSRFRVEEKAPQEIILVPVQPRFARRILAVDQSLTAAGWALIEGNGEVVTQGTVKITEEATGHEGTLSRGARQFIEFTFLIGELDPDDIVHETPPIARPGMKMMRPEASLVSATALRCAAATLSISITMVASQKAKKRWTGKRDATKKEVREALFSLDPTLPGRKPMNEHVVDAIALGWVALEEER